MSYKTYANVGKRNKTKNATQSTKLKGQVKNSDGTYVYQLDEWNHLDRFLILGTEGGSYYASEQKLTKSNAKNVSRLIDKDGVRVVDRVVEISLEGRAPKNDPALFVLAMASLQGDLNTRQAAYAALPKVARIGTHLFHFIAFREAIGGGKGNTDGWSAGLRRAVARWYNNRDAGKLAIQLGKYQARDGWSHRDLLRLAHIKPVDEAHDVAYKWVVNSKLVLGGFTEKDFAADKRSRNGYTRSAKDKYNQALEAQPRALEVFKSDLAILNAFEEVKATDNQKRVLELIEQYRLPLEMVPTDKRDRKVYELMLENFGITALIRNLGKLSNIGILTEGNFKEMNKVTDRLTDVEALKSGRVHPIAVLLALMTYKQGRGVKGKLTWNPSQKIVDALDEAFHLSFNTIEPTGKRIMIALDVSGSMGWGAIPNTFLTARDASAAMSMAVARTEKNYVVTGFCNNLKVLNVTGKQNLDQVIRTVSGLSFGSTDCSLPFEWAIKNKMEFDAFMVYTDNETNHYRSRQPSVALKDYRNRTGIDAKLIVNGMTATNFTIADPNDPGMLDIVGFDASAPKIMSDFISGRF